MSRSTPKDRRRRPRPERGPLGAQVDALEDQLQELAMVTSAGMWRTSLLRGEVARLRAKLRAAREENARLQVAVDDVAAEARSVNGKLALERVELQRGLAEIRANLEGLSVALAAAKARTSELEVENQALRNALALAQVSAVGIAPVAPVPVVDPLAKPCEKCGKNLADHARISRPFSGEMPYLECPTSQTVKLGEIDATITGGAP